MSDYTICQNTSHDRESDSEGMTYCPTCNPKTCRQCGTPETKTKLWTIETGALYCDPCLPPAYLSEAEQDRYDDLSLDYTDDELHDARDWQDQWDEYERIVR